MFKLLQGDLDEYLDGRWVLYSPAVGADSNATAMASTDLRSCLYWKPR